MSLAHEFTRFQRAYRYLEDDLSRRVFKARLTYDITGSLEDMACFDVMSGDTDGAVIERAKDSLRQLKSVAQMGRKLFLYGAGAWGKQYLNLFLKNPESVEVYGFCDRDEGKQKTGFLRKPVISQQELLRDHKDDYLLITSWLYNKEIRSELIERGFPQEHILDFDLLWCTSFDTGLEYFEFPIPMEVVFVDAGCYQCDTVLHFIKASGGRYEKILAFEPDHRNMESCRRIADENHIQNIELFEAGLWDREEMVNFVEENGLGSHVDTDAQAGSASCVKMVALDQIIKQEHVSFIKMDIEGAELKALHGARRTIAENKPLLAICVYHKPEDFVEIAEYIKSIEPEYKLYLRQYGTLPYSTILYAIP